MARRRAGWVAAIGPLLLLAAALGLDLAPPRTVATVGSSIRLTWGRALPRSDARQYVSVVRTLQRILGPPRSPIEIALTSRGTAVDLGDLRELIRFAVPAWYGRTRSEMEADASGDAWFLLGLSEYLAHVVPERAGRTTRSGEVAIERSWVAAPGIEHEDVRAPIDGSREAIDGRRLAAAARIHELSSGAGVELRTVLDGYDGEGLPAALRGALDGPLGAIPFEPSFVDDWRIRLEETPSWPGERPAAERTRSILFTASLEGRLDPCGCSERQAGGVARQVLALGEAVSDPRHLLLVDVGGFAAVDPDRAEYDRVLEEEMRAFASLLFGAGYDALTVGSEELYAGADRLWPGPECDGVPLCSSGLRVSGRSPYPSSVTIERGGSSVVYLGVSEHLELGRRRELHEANLVDVDLSEDPERLVEEIRALSRGAGLLVVGGYLRPATLRRICEPDLGVDVVLLRGYRGYPLLEGPRAGFLGRTAVAFDEVGAAGFNLLEIRLSADDEITSVELASRRLDRDAPEDPGVRARLLEVQRRIVALPELRSSLRPVHEGIAAFRGVYVGAERCASCHPKRYDAWRDTKHATSMRSLDRKRRGVDPRCLRCHADGAGRAGGYAPGSSREHLATVGCESCHGAGGDHVSNPRARYDYPVPVRQGCVGCHDAEHSPVFEPGVTHPWSCAVR